MVTPVNVARNTTSGANLYAGRSATPAWISSKPLNQWFNAPNSVVANLVTDSGTAGAGIMNVYSGTVIAKGKLYAFGGGHGATSDNTVARYDLLDGTGWEVFVQPTPAGQRLAASNTGTMTLDNFWWGDPGNLKPNPPHTYDYGQYVPELNRIIWFCHRGVYNYSGAIGAAWDRFLQLKLDTGTWVQPGSADDVMTGGNGTLTNVRLSDGKILLETGGSSIRVYDPSLPVGSQVSTWLTNNALNWTGYGKLLLDAAHNRLLRVGNGYSTAAYLTVDLTTKTVTDIKASLTGQAGVLSGLDTLSGQDTLGACIDPINNRAIIPVQAAGGGFYAINLDTLAVTLEAPTVMAGSTVSGNPGGASCYGRIHYYEPFKCIFYSPDGAGSLCVMRLG